MIPGKGTSMTRNSLAAACATALILFAVPASAATIFVSNEKDNTITVIDSETLKTIKTIETARAPRGLDGLDGLQRLAVDDRDRVVLLVGNEDGGGRGGHGEENERRRAGCCKTVACHGCTFAGDHLNLHFVSGLSKPSVSVR